MVNFKHALGLGVKTKVAGLVGILVSRSENLYGCNRYYVQPKVVKDMRILDGWWVDEDDIIVIAAGVTTPKKHTDGPMRKVN